MATIKPTHKDPISPQSEKFEKDFKKTMVKTGLHNIREGSLNEVDSMLSEVEQSLKKKISSLAKMESLVFSDPKLSAVYDEMAENGEEKYGYHYNETIQNMIFNDYVLNSPKYLQKYKMAIPKEKKRRDKSGINQLKKQGEKKMSQSGLAKLEPNAENESVMEEEVDNNVTKVIFLVNERDPKDPDLFAYFPEEIYDISGKYRVAYSHTGQHSSAHPDYAKESREATPEEYNNLKTELEGQGYKLEVLNGMQESTSAGSAGGAAGYVGYAGPAAFSSKGDLSGDFKGKKKKKSIDPKAKPISTGFALHETDYLIDPSGFETIFNELNESSSATSGNAEGYDTPIGFRDDVKNVSKQLDTERELNDLDTVRTVEPGQEKRAYGKDLPSGENVSSAIAKPDINKDVKKPFYKGGKVTSPFLSGGEKVNGTVLAKHSQPETMNEESKSKSQQQLMGMAYAYKTGKFDGEPSDSIKKIADGMSEKDLEDFATTKHKGLPDHVDEGYSIMNPDPLKQIGWLSLPKYKYGGVAIFQISENDDFGNKVGAEYIIGSPYEFEFVIQPDGENNYTIQQNPKFWQRYASIDNDSNKVLYVDDNEKFKYLGKYKDIKLDPNNRWTYDSETEKFWQEIEKLKGEGATFEFNGNQIFDNDNIKEDMQTMIDNNGTSMSNKSQATGDMSSELPMGTQQTSGLNESDVKLLEEINKELEAFSIHHDKLKIMAENKKTPSMVQGDRLRAENPKNFKKDIQHSGTKDIIDVEKELQWKDQQTDVGDPQKLGMDIEKQEIKVADMKGDEALKNVGDSTNDDGDQIPKRNLTSEEQKEVDLYRNGQHSLNYDNKPDERFVDRMKADQGEFFEIGEKQKEFKADAPMYDKDSQPVDDGIEKVQFDKNVKKKGEKVAWNERMGLESNVKLSESMITGRYKNILGKSQLIEFRLNEVQEIESVDEGFAALNFAGLGNTYMSKTIDKKVVVNEGVVNTINRDKFYTDGKQVFVIQTPTQSLNEGEVKEEKPVINEQMDKMKHLLGYKPEAYVNTNNVKKNRKF